MKLQIPENDAHCAFNVSAHDCAIAKQEAETSLQSDGDQSTMRAAESQGATESEGEKAFDRANPPPLPIWVYHGTGPDAFADIEEEGVDPDSYWAGNFEQAKSYADSFGDAGVVLACRIGDYDFEANRLVAQFLHQQDELEESEIPDERELAYSLELFEGIICRDRIFRYEVVTGKMPE